VALGAVLRELLLDVVGIVGVVKIVVVTVDTVAGQWAKIIV